MRVAKLDSMPGFDLKAASRPGGFDLITLAGRLNEGLRWPKCNRQETARREKMTDRVQKEIVREVTSVLDALQDPSGSPDPLKKLVNKINSLGLRGTWSVAQSKTTRVDDDTVIPIDSRSLRIG